MTGQATPTAEESAAFLAFSQGIIVPPSLLYLPSSGVVIRMICEKGPRPTVNALTMHS